MRRFLFFVLLIILTGTLFADTIKDYFAPENWIPDKIVYAMGNDKWTVGGLSYNWDDQLSYSEHLYIRAPSWSFAIDWNGITNRGWQEGWDINDYSKPGDGNRIQGRYDELQMYFGFPADLIDNDKLWLWINPEFGVSIAGNQSHDIIQNFSHDFLNKVAAVDLPYEIEGNNVYPLVRSELELGYVFKEYDMAYLFSSIRLKDYYTIGFGKTNSFMAIVGLTGEYDDMFTVGLGYSWNEAQSGWKTQELYYDYINGLTLSMMVDTGLFSLNYTTALSHNIGYGTLCLDILSIPREETWEETDIAYSIGMVFQLNNTFFTNEISLPIKGSRWELYLSDRYFSGDPSFKGWELDLDHDKAPRYKRSYNAVFLGGKYNFELLRKDSLIQPFAKVGLGLMKWEIRTVSNMQTVTTVHNPETGEKEEVVNKIHSTISPTLTSACADIEFGISCLRPGIIVSSNSTFQISVFTGVTAIHNPMQIQDYLETYTEDGLRISRFIPRWGFALEMDFDV